MAPEPFSFSAKRGADGVGHDAALHAVGVEVAGVQMLGAPDAAADPRGAAQQLRHQPRHVVAVDQEMAVGPVAGEDDVPAAVQRIDHAHRAGLLPDGSVHGPSQQPLRIEVEKRLLRAPDQPHLPIELLCYPPLL